MKEIPHQMMPTVLAIFIPNKGWVSRTYKQYKIIKKIMYRPRSYLGFPFYLFIWGAFDIQILYIKTSKEALTFKNGKVYMYIPRRNFTYVVAAQYPFYVFIMEWLH